MTALDFTHRRDGDAGCPSDLTVDRLVAGELAEAAARSTERHAEGCASCRTRLAERRAGWDGFPEIDARASLAALRRKLDERRPKESLLARLGRRWFAVAPLAVIGAACLVLVARPHHGSAGGSPAPTIHFKGGLALRVWKMTEGGSDEIASGTALHSGDRIRFVVDLPREGWVRIVDVGAGGAPSTAWPEQGDAEQRSAGPAQVLPGAVELDQSASPEHLFLVACADEAAPARCGAHGTDLSCPAGCSVAAFVLNKAP